MQTVVPILSHCLQHLQTFLPQSRRPLSRFVVLALDLLISIASFGFQPSQRRSPRPSSSLTWYYGLKFIVFSSVIMLPYTWALTLVETLCSVSGGLNGLYFPRRVRGYLLAQYLLWFFTKKLADKLLNELPYIGIAEFERHVDDNADFDRARKGFQGALQRAPFTSFSLASVLSIYLLCDATNHFRNPSPSSAALDPDSILGPLLPPICTFVIGFLVLQALCAQVEYYHQTLPSHTPP